MFGTLRNKFQMMQESISASMKGLAVTETSKQKKFSNTRNVNYNAGADILHRFQLQWNELHELAEENAEKAQEVDKLISTIYEKLEQEWKSIQCLNNTLAYIPKLNSEIQDLMDQIGTLQVMFEETENTIYEVEQMNNLLSLQTVELNRMVQGKLNKKSKEKLMVERVLKHEQKEQIKEEGREAEGFKEDEETASTSNRS